MSKKVARTKVNETAVSLEENTTTHDCWWNTSDGLRVEFPGIETKAGWKKFSSIYDIPKLQDVRLRHWNESTPKFSLPGKLFKIRELAELALGKEPSGPRLTRPTNISAKRAGEELAGLILDLLSKRESSRFKELADAIFEYHNPKTTERNSRDLVWALIQFIERSGRLPLKKELNIEAGRISLLVRLELNTSKPPEWGSVLEGKTFGKSANAKKYRVYGFVDDEEGQHAFGCPKALWDDPRWDKSEFSKHLAACGLSGLGEANTHPTTKSRGRI